MFALAIILCVARAAMACDKAKEGSEANSSPAHKAKTQQTASPQHEKVSLTGSYIKSNVRRAGQVTDGVEPVIVLDNATIQRSGAADLRQLLVRQGASR